ncbi:cell division protein FtsQ/DivIB [Alteribacillus sp. HJP-4]|uniref:cell division protein FtsQ/DivIB n=1 Tax=Alteribacillus sp. HJP-4 TaxID=2775394 RepID=UPI0035CD0C0A
MSEKKVVTLNDRIPAWKEQRKKRSNRRLILSLSIFFILILLVVYFQSPLSHIRTIEVNGLSYTEEEMIIEASGIQTGTSMWNMDKQAAERNINQLDEISEAEVSRSIFSAVTIEAEEMEQVGYAFSEGEYVPVLKNGHTLTGQSRSTFSSDAPVLHGFKNEQKLEAMAEELGQLGDGILNMMSEVILTPTKEDENALRIYMNDGVEVASTINNFSRNMASYPSVSQEIDPGTSGILHMKMSPYFEADEVEQEEQEAEESQDNTENQTEQSVEDEETAPVEEEDAGELEGQNETVEETGEEAIEEEGN